MKGITLEFNDIDKRVSITVEPGECDPKALDFKTVRQFFQTSEYADCLLDEEALTEAIDTARSRMNEVGAEQINIVIAQQIDAKLVIDIDKDSMSVSATIVGAYGGTDITAQDIFDRLSLLGIKRGIGKKRIVSLVDGASIQLPGQQISKVIALGLQPRAGKDSRVIPLVENALERILKPQEVGNDKVDMRDLGKIICVHQGQAVARKLEPQPGRDGFDVFGRRLGAQYGEEQPVELGQNTEFNADAQNVIVASVAGQPKFIHGVMHIDDVYTVDGVNVRTGNIEYDGAVIVNGDVTENMKIVATGDITINGFVESAFIKTDGDIIITQGISGKQNNDDCKLEAGGSISVFHAQHANLVAKQDVRVNKQLSASTITVGGDLIVGKSEDIVDGNLFGCKVYASKRVAAGKIGAISGSKLVIDYSQAYMRCLSKLEALNDLREQLESSNADHEIKLVKLKQRRLKPSALEKLDSLGVAIREERLFLNWLRNAENVYADKVDEFKKHAQVVAYSVLFPNVSIIVNNENFVSSKEANRTEVNFKSGSWLVKPL